MIRSAGSRWRERVGNSPPAGARGVGGHSMKQAGSAIVAVEQERNSAVPSPSGMSRVPLPFLNSVRGA